MNRWKEKSNELKSKMRLRTEPIAYRKFEKAKELDSIKNLVRWEGGSSFCQIPFLARVQGLTVGVTREAKMISRCKGIHGLLPMSEKAIEMEATMMATTWMPDKEQSMKQQADYPRIPAGEAVVLAPLAKEKIEPEVVLVYGNPAQLMMILCGIQKIEYVRFEFFFIGEGACVDSLGQCYKTGKPSLAIPCYGERSMGQVMDDEIALALPPAEVDKALAGLDKLAKVGFKYPISPIGGVVDPLPVLAGVYGDKK
ncbi:MAG: DUF169 domain-containing protein [Proteobacteria bacterium]|nr:DUF169 domain-containing protein [Pseudomonadota bacterium]